MKSRDLLYSEKLILSDRRRCSTSRHLMGTLLALTYLFASSSEGSAWSSSCGLCVPPELIGRAQALEESFGTTNRDDLARQSWAGQICQYHPCEDEVTEDQARELLRGFFAREQRAQDLSRADRDRTATWVGIIIAAISAVISVGGLVVSFMALRQSGRNERDIGRLEGQSPREVPDFVSK